MDVFVLLNNNFICDHENMNRIKESVHNITKLFKTLRKIKTSLDYFGAYIDVFSYLGLVSFIWDETNQKLTYSQNIRQHFRIKCCVVLASARLAYLLSAFAWQCKDPSTNLFERAILFVFLSVGILIEVGCVTVATEGEFLAEFFNRILCNDNIFKDCVVSHSKETEKHLLVEKLLLKYWVPLIIITAEAYFILCANYIPGIHLLADGLLPNPTGTVIVLTHAALNVLDLAIVTWTYVQTVIAWLNVMLFCNRTSIWFLHLRSVRDGLNIQIFKRIQIFIFMIVDSFPTFYLVPSIICVSILATFNTYVLIKSNIEDTPLILYSMLIYVSMLCELVIMAFLMCAGKCWFHSYEILMQMRRTSSRSSIRRKELKSLKPCGIKYGPLRAVKIKHCFDHNEAICNALISFLAIAKQ